MSVLQVIFTFLFYLVMAVLFGWAVFWLGEALDGHNKRIPPHIRDKEKKK